ncbi:MAG: serine hydrolase [Cytophagales bacterium]|nr:serine hydrolase [Cytophagales bacterium]
MTFTYPCARPLRALAAACLTGLLAFTGYRADAQNTAIAYAYPVGKLTIDGDLSDWPKDLPKYRLAEDDGSKPKSATDFTAHYRVAYNPDNRSVYVAVEVTDDDHVVDTTKSPAWNTQDCQELYVDARHLPSGSGVAAFMLSKTFRDTNKMRSDPVSAAISWDNIEARTARQGNLTVYEWRVDLGEHVYPGRSIGLDLNVFDKDKNGFKVIGWGRGSYKFRTPGNVGDVVLMRASEGLGTLGGKLKWKEASEQKLPGRVRLTSVKTPALWVDAKVDSLGRYTVQLPPATYRVSMPGHLVEDKESVFRVNDETLSEVTLKAGEKKVVAATSLITRSSAPDLVPQQGILHAFDAGKAAQLDQFVAAYQQFYEIPGVSLALVKDGKVVYHKTYGVANSLTGEKVADNTLFEAASITKSVFAYVVNRLAERGVIDLDKPLYQYLPFEAIAHDDRYKLITARHVLSHRTGFPNWSWMNPDGKIDIKFTPGTQYGYSGEGFEYLKRVVVHVTGKDILQVLQEEVIGPMNIYNVHFSKNEELVKVASYGHYDNIPSTQDIPDEPGMAHSMYTEAKGFSQFMLGLLNGQGLQPDTYTRMLTMYSVPPLEKGEAKPRYKEGMGLGIAVRESAYGPVFGHGGNNGDFQCEFEVYKDLKMGYVVFTNSNRGSELCREMKALLVEGKEGVAQK